MKEGREKNEEKTDEKRGRRKIKMKLAASYYEAGSKRVSGFGLPVEQRVYWVHKGSLKAHMLVMCF